MVSWFVGLSIVENKTQQQVRQGGRSFAHFFLVLLLHLFGPGFVLALVLVLV